MGILGCHSWEDDGPRDPDAGLGIGCGASERHETRQRNWERAKAIVSGAEDVSMFGEDEEVMEMVRGLWDRDA